MPSSGTISQIQLPNGNIYDLDSNQDHVHGNITPDGELQSSDITIDNGDKLVVTDASDTSKIARTNIAFDGSTTTKFLSKKGTWEDVDGKMAVEYSNDRVIFYPYDIADEEEY